MKTMWVVQNKKTGKFDGYLWGGAYDRVSKIEHAMLFRTRQQARDHAFSDDTVRKVHVTINIV